MRPNKQKNTKKENSLFYLGFSPVILNINTALQPYGAGMADILIETSTYSIWSE